jgi:hypothetical protein
MARILRKLKINDVSAVDKGAGRGVRVLLTKRYTGETEMSEFEEVVKRDRGDGRLIFKTLEDIRKAVRKGDLTKEERAKAEGSIHRFEAMSKGIVDPSVYGEE